MSYYYNYCIGYMHDGKIYPLGPYDCNGKLCDVISRSRSFASDLHEDFMIVSEEQISDELRKEFEYEDWNGNKVVGVKYLPLSDLPGGSYIKSGYFLISDVQLYEQYGKDKYDELFYDCLTPTVYAAKLLNDLAANKNVKNMEDPVSDESDEDIERPHPATDYMFFAYPDYSSKAYECEVIRTAADYLEDYSRTLPKGYKLVVLETEG